MILYVDSSALVKRYTEETHSKRVRELVRRARSVGTAEITQVEVIAAFKEAERMGTLNAAEASRARRDLLGDWPSLVRLTVSVMVLNRAGELAWQHPLRGYDAVQLAAAQLWQEALGEEIDLATFDEQLWDAATTTGLRVWPADLK
ncbi:MAG: type II toxin-antitoxin system VapC family toxin [Acidobacteriota bacterium]